MTKSQFQRNKKKLLKSKSTTQKSWGVARRINPRGKKHNWNVMTVDGYESIEDIFQSINSAIPGISKLNLEPISQSFPDGWYEQIIWENIIRVNANGEIIEQPKINMEKYAKWLSKQQLFSQYYQ